jgi:hypothetical protein
MSDTPDPSESGDTGAEAAPVPVEPDPISLAGAGGPVGGSVAGEVLDALNQPLPPPEEPAP